MKDQSVFLVLDEEFKGDIIELSRNRHLWICNSKSNTPKIQDAWESGSKEYREDSGVTSFDIENGKIEAMYSTLGSIDEHHGGDPFLDLSPWSVIKVIGVSIQDVDKEKILKWLQVDTIEMVQERDGFSILRPSNGN